jgi:hypothetical protein
MDDGGVHLMLTGEGAPKAVLTSLSEDDIDDPAAILALLDKDGQGGVHIGGRRYRPFVRFKDPRGTVRTSYELGVNGEPELYVFDEEGTSVSDADTFDRLVAERGPVYQWILFGSVLVVGAVGGAWIARTASAASGLPAALVTVVVLAAFIALRVLVRRRGW